MFVGLMLTVSPRLRLAFDYAGQAPLYANTAKKRQYCGFHKLFEVRIRAPDFWTLPYKENNLQHEIPMRSSIMFELYLRYMSQLQKDYGSFI